MRAKKRKPFRREQIWKTIRKFKSFAVSDLGTDLDNSPVYAFLNGLVAAGYLEREGKVQTKLFGANRYRLIKDAVEAPYVRKDGTVPTRGSGRARMWRAMKILPSFTIVDLVACCEKGGPAVATWEARTYVAYLERAGYLKRLDAHGVALASFKLVRWTGPRPPMIQRIKQVFDPNLKKVVWRPKAEEGDDDR
jgi:hypothetical protein